MKNEIGNHKEKVYKHIIWDWNGTLLDDVNIVINVMNTLLIRRKLPLLDEERYKDVFTFPVKDYYTLLGFNFEDEPFEKLAIEYISEFNSDKYDFRLYDGVKDVLEHIIRSGMTQSILSACNEKDLIAIVNKLHIEEYFIKIAGLNDYYAASKVERGKGLLCDLGLMPDEVLIIGDTVHDYEVSKEIGCDCLLTSNGHQNYHRISCCHTGIIKSVSEVVGLIKGVA